MAKYRIHVIVYDVNGNPASKALVNIGPTPPNVVPTVFTPSNYIGSGGTILRYLPESMSSIGYTNALGEYISSPLKPGRYTIAVTAAEKGGIPQGIGTQDVQLTDHDITITMRLKAMPSILPLQFNQPDKTTQTGVLTSDKNFWLGLAIGGALLYLLLRR